MILTCCREERAALSLSWPRGSLCWGVRRATEAAKRRIQTRRHTRKRRNGMPSLFATTREFSGITLVDLSGRISLGDVNYIDSSGIGELVSGFSAVRNRGGELKLLNLTKKVHDLLQITKLFTVFDVFNEESTAVRSFE